MPYKIDCTLIGLLLKGLLDELSFSEGDNVDWIDNYIKSEYINIVQIDCR